VSAKERAIAKVAAIRRRQQSSAPEAVPAPEPPPPTSMRPGGAPARQKRPGRGRAETLVWSATTRSGQVIALAIKDLDHGFRAIVWRSHDPAAGWSGAVQLLPDLQRDALAAFTSAVATIGGTRPGAVQPARTSWKIPEPEAGTRRGAPPARWLERTRRWAAVVARSEAEQRALEAAARGTP